MMEALWRLLWALPLVMLAGMLALLLLKRWVTPQRRSTAPKQRLSRSESLALSDETRVHLLKIDGKAYVLVESTRQTLLHATAANETNGWPQRPGLRALSQSWRTAPR